MNSIPASMLKTIYRKTPAGDHEVLTRQLGLSAKQRRTLILIDGEKSIGILSSLVLEMELLPAIAKLEELGLIHSAQNQQLQQTQSKPNPIQIRQPIQAKTLAAKPALDSIRLNAIKTLMIDSSETLLGVFGKTLVEKIKIVNDESQLNNAISQWNISLRESKKGQEHADQYLEAIKTLMK
ncbi:MAG: hypothetical protein ACRC01_12315 [Deefgea sp.]